MFSRALRVLGSPLSALRELAERPMRRRAMRFYSSFIARGDLCIDVGANIGQRTELFLGLGAKVVCVEPQAACVRILREKYGRDSRVTIIASALGEREGTSDIWVCGEAPAISTMSERWRTEGRFAESYEWGEKQVVPVTTLDAIIARHGPPAFCKIDVEGFEEQVLLGLSQPIPVISFEFTKEFFADAVRCLASLSKIGPVVVNYSLGESMELTLSDWVPAASLDALGEQLPAGGWGDIYVKTVRPTVNG